MFKKKVVLIGAIPPPYHGVNIFHERFLKSKIKSIYDIYHLDTSDHRDLGNLGKLDLRNIFLSLKNFFSLFNLICKVKPDLVYLAIAQNLAYLRDGIFILIISYFSKVKIIVHLHNSYFKKYYNECNWLIKRFIDLTMNKVDAGIVLGNSLKFILNKWVKDIKIVPNGTNFNPDISKKNIGNKKDVVVGYLGNFYEFKGVLDLVKAAKMVLKEYMNVKFRFAGSWPGEDAEIKKTVFEFIKKNGLSDRIEFIGLVLDKEKERFLIDTDIFVFPSWNEGQPYVILEAMSAACPVISIKDVGAIPETVIGGETGILVEKKNPKAIADAIVYLIEHSGERLRMGFAGRKRFEENYTLEKNVENMIRVFEEVLE